MKNFLESIFLLVSTFTYCDQSSAQHAVDVTFVNTTEAITYLNITEKLSKSDFREVQKVVVELYKEVVVPLMLIGDSYLKDL